MKSFWGKRYRLVDNAFLRQGAQIIVYNSNPCSVPRKDGMESVRVEAESREDARKMLEEIERASKEKK